jgi:GR25 family glycosyltransferase involved in LPS biosynthesis
MIQSKRVAYVINLKKRPDRLTDFYNKFRKFHNDKKTSLFLKEAVDAEELESNENYKKLFKNKKTRLTKGEIGCFISHYEIYKEIIDKKLPYAVIYEDDVEFHSKFTELCNKVFDEIPKDFMILYLGGRHTCIFPQYLEPITPNISKHFSTIISPVDSDRTTHAYVISNSCCQILCQLIEQQTEYMLAIDHFILRNLLAMKIPVLNSVPLICWSDNCSGDIRR